MPPTTDVTMNISEINLTGFLALVASVLTLTLHIGCCMGIAKDAARLERQGRGPFFLITYQWALAGLLLGVLALAVFWLIHHSTISTLATPPKSEPSLMERLTK